MFEFYSDWKNTISKSNRKTFRASISLSRQFAYTRILYEYGYGRGLGGTSEEGNTYNIRNGVTRTEVAWLTRVSKSTRKAIFQRCTALASPTSGDLYQRERFNAWIITAVAYIFARKTAKKSEEKYPKIFSFRNSKIRPSSTFLLVESDVSVKWNRGWMWMAYARYEYYIISNFYYDERWYYC